MILNKDNALTAAIASRYTHIKIHIANHLQATGNMFTANSTAGIILQATASHRPSSFVTI